ncbi:GAF domain-containing protein [Streptomyces adelaidensis]|uniref:GAF domain-containing protein n=1 Tax=Streptomyces adelaidensis TaxID=2796465 RepID=UPI001906F6A7|nr:GAF domain-containing protein [Streptomyces adelaidensis]
MTSVALNETVLKNSRREVDEWLAAFVARNGGFVGSVHLSEPAEEGEIVLVGSHNLPPSVRNGTAVIPIGKGMAGTAAQRRAPVVISDFQSDTTGVAVPGGRAVGSVGSLTLPVFDPADDTRLLAVVGLGFPERRDFTDEDLTKYGEDAMTVLTVI